MSTRNPVDNSRGAEVVDVVPGGPADAAGVQVGDMITEVAGKEVLGSAELGGILREPRAGHAGPGDGRPRRRVDRDA